MPNILVIDDDINIRNIVKLHLERDNYKVILAEDALEGISMLTSEHPDLILLDVIMPKVDGYEVLDVIKNSEDFRHIPVIMLTVKDQFQDKLQGFQHGADDYLPKPFEIRELLARIKALLRLKEIQKKIIQSERMAAIGQIALTIKHEINNPLTGVVGQAEMILQKKKNLPSDILRMLEEIYEDGLTIQEIVSQLEQA